MHTLDMPSAKRFSFTPTALLAGVVVGVLALLSLSPQSARAQDSSPSQQDKAMHYSLYYESYKNDEFEAAKSDLNWIIENAPGFPKQDDRNFRRQFALYRGLASNTENEEKRKAYLDTAATVLATAPQKMDSLDLSYEQFEWEVRRGRFLQEYQDSLPELNSDVLDSPTSHYRKAFELAPKEVNPYYIQQTLRAYLENNEQNEALSFMEEVQSKRGDDEEVNEILSSVRDDIFGKNPQAKVQYLEDQYEAHPDSAEVMQSLFDAYVQQGNIQKASKLASKLMETNPPAETVREIAEMRLEDGRPEEAIQAYEKAVDQGAELTAQDHFNMGNAYRQMGDFPEARNEFREALDMDPEFAEALVAIGDLYARAVQDCSGSELSRMDKAVYWAAVDKYEEAIEANSSISSTAESKIRSYRKVFPTQEDIFYRDNMQKGESFTIDYGCYSWIGETTTVRPAP